MSLSVFFVDNYDSFSFNLVDEFLKRGCEVEVWRNRVPVDQAMTRLQSMTAPRLLVISPGPGTPDQAGNGIELVQSVAGTIAVFGICLGHQIIVEAFGGKVGPCGTIVHGKTSRIRHGSEDLFCDLPDPLLVGRYHSLAALEMPPTLRTTAVTEEIVMGCRHVDLPVWGLQFHPESILTPRGGRLIDNLIREVVAYDG